MFRKTVLAHALTFAFGAAALTVGVMEPALAQSNATGNVVGTVATPAGATINLQSLDTGFKRSVTADASGRYQFTSLPVGRYQVDLVRGDKVVESATVDVVLGQSATASFTGIQTVQVTGRRSIIDVTNTNNGATFTARELNKLPIARNVEAIIQLAPNTTRADERFAGGASFGGGAASENSYYINGYPVVNPLTGLGASQLPFGAIAQAQVLTGGFGAEFGRSVGGVVNITTKSGTNRWEAGAMVSWRPESMYSKPKDLYYANTGAPENAKTDGTLRRRRADNTVEEKVYGAYVGGPIIQDKLFMFLAAEQTDRDANGVSSYAGQGERLSTSLAKNGWRDSNTKIERYLAKFDWNITDSHRLEFTAIGDTPTVTNRDSGYDYDKPGHGDGKVNYTEKLTNVDDNGGKTNMFKYTGNLTDDFTITALAGRTKSPHENEFEGYAGMENIFSVSAPTNVRAPGLNYTNPQPIGGNILAPGSSDTVKAYRLDLEYKLGSHTIRGGIDKVEVESAKAGEFKAGGGTWFFLKTDNPNEPQSGTGGEIPAPATGGGLGTQGYYVDKQLFSDVTSSFGIQNAQYLEDKWQLTKDLLLTIGVRRESFTNQNGDRKTFLEMKNQYNPRFAASWDVYGDASLKVFGTMGRYSVPIPTHITVRGAGRSTYTDQYFTYTGVDANGQPTGLVALTEPQSGNNEFGQEKDLKTLAALGMKPSYQDEITLGFERAWSPTLNFGARVTYRTLKSTIDDFCDVRPFEKWAAAHNVEITNPLWGNTCQTFNPGEDNSFWVDFQGGGTNDTLVHLTAAEQGFEKPKRTYAALDLFAEHPLRDGWYGRINYTLSRNAGNTEGQVRSDNGQADVSVTSTWDYPELMQGAYGRLPNDRKHQIKAYGFYEITKEWGVGANLLLASGRPRSCIGTEPNPRATGSPGYTNQTFYCGGATRSQNVIIPRGTLGDLPWDKRLDLSVEYRPAMVQGLSAKVDVINITNTQVVSSVSEARNVRGNTRIASTYESPLTYTTPRYVKLTLAYDHKF